MKLQLDTVTGAGIALPVIGIVIILGCCALFVVHFLLTLPMRRAERARMFLDLIETAAKDGQRIEEALISVSRSRDTSLGVRFHLIAAWLEESLRLQEALAKVPRFLPPQITAMLIAGQKIGDLRKVIPACRQLLKDSVSQTRAAISYLVILTFVITPAGIWVFTILKIIIFPKFVEIGLGFGDLGMASALDFIYNHGAALIGGQIAVLLLLWLGAIIYIGGPRVVSWFPLLERIHYWLPWRRKRMQRDFSIMLGVLLDSGVPEADAVTLAAESTANKVFRERAARAVDALKRGAKLTVALKTMDDSGEFGWRLSNALHSRNGFLEALAGWHESLDAKAFQQEQAAAHGITSALVLWNGIFVGAIVISVFMCLVSFLNSAVLW